MTKIRRELAPKEVHCWFLLLRRFAAEELFTFLSPNELQRAARFVFDRDRIDYTVCRGVLRLLLAMYGAGPASRVRFEYSAWGKPSLMADQNPDDIEFNVAHSQGEALIGITRKRPIGVDIEQVRPIEDFSAMVRTCFAAEEQAEFWSLPEPFRARAFFAGWTRKEAFVKATGEGLARPLGSFVLTLAPGIPPRLLRVNEDSGAGLGWTVVDLTRESSTVAALAVREANAFVQVFDLHPKILGLSEIPLGKY